MSYLVVISGCSGGGKSTLMVELARRGMKVVAEPGLRVIQEQTAVSGKALPWIDLGDFLNNVWSVASEDYAQAVKTAGDWVFFDRGLVDAAAAIGLRTGEDPKVRLEGYHYNRTVFLAPPWPDIYQVTSERRHSFQDAEAEYHRLKYLYPSMGYSIVELPKLSVDERANFVLELLGRSKIS